ncbi:double zinc ribbon domain-containing protein [Azohydromonas aeria]|uniref:double zinc ribbon domain-containing protein n=1 Tax=Azohydromonas aeria TaxID=2590212 RepID=UPI0012F7B44A
MRIFDRLFDGHHGSKHHGGDHHAGGRHGHNDRHVGHGVPADGSQCHAQPVVVQASLAPACPKCCVIAPAGSRFCSQCGTSLNACTQCGAGLQSGGRFCGQCGNPVS